MKHPCLPLALAIALSTVTLATVTLPAAALAQGFPSKPIRIVVPFVAGGAVDTLARIMGAKVAEQLGQPVIVENRPGAGGNVAADAVAKAPPDGYTILQNTNGQAISPAMYRSLPFDVVRDFSPATQLVASHLGLAAAPKLSATSWQGWFVPANPPREIVAVIQQAARKALAEPDVIERLRVTGNEAVGSTSEEFAATFKADLAKFAGIVKDAKIPVQD